MKLETFEILIEVLSPLHIGSGDELVEGADFVVSNRPGGSRVALLVDVDQALLSFRPEEIGNIRQGRVAAALGERGLQMYQRDTATLVGAGNANRVRAMMRLSDGRPYIPGTTIKGSIRTALLAASLESNRELLSEIPGERRDPRQAARSLEEAAFGVEFAQRRATFQNRDLNRAVRVADFEPVGETRIAFTNMSAHRLGSRGERGGQIPIWCEAVLPQAKFKGTITLEKESALWEAIGAPRRQRLEQLFSVWAQWGKRLAEAESQAWMNTSPPVKQFFDGVSALPLPTTLGWGSGWRAKTVGLLMPGNKIAEVAQAYDMRRWRGQDFPARFPITRKLASLPGGGQAPPGWVSVAVTGPRQQEK